MADSVDEFPDVIGVGDALGVHTGVAQGVLTVTVDDALQEPNRLVADTV